MNESKIPSVISDQVRNDILHLSFPLFPIRRFAVPSQKPCITLETSGRRLKARVIPYFWVVIKQFTCHLDS